MKRKIKWLLLSLAVGVALFLASPRPVMQIGIGYRMESLEYRGREVTGEVDTQALWDLLRTARMGRLPGGSPPYDADGVKIDLAKEPDGPLYRIVLSRRESAGRCLVYTGGKSYVIRDGEALADAVLALMPEN